MLNSLIKHTDNTRTITFIYFFLLLYTVAALVWWGVLLYRQNSRIMELQQEVLALKASSPLLYEQEAPLIQKEKRLRELQYIGEGGTFLLIILLSAGFVFRAVRRQIGLAKQQQNFMAAITHELKSPIAVIRLNLETLQKHELAPERKQRFLETTLSELNRLNQLCNNMLLASQFDSRQYRLVKEKVDLSELTGKAAHEAGLRMQHYKIVTRLPPGLLVDGDQFMLQIAINNLLENASKYAPGGTTISIRLLAGESKIKLQIADEGPGIPSGEKERVFNRFYRIGNENTRKTKGTGLGLFLTQKIVRQHNGSITILDNTPKGAIFEVTLPRVTAS